MAKISIKTLNLFLMLIFFGLVISGVSYKCGKRNGYTNGYATAQAEAKAFYEEQINWYDQESQKAWHAGYDYCHAELDKECDDQLKASNALCKDDLEKAYKMGIETALKKISVKCGKSSK